MTDLQIGLLAIGCAIITGVWGYNRWTTWRMAPLRSPTPASAMSPSGSAGEGDVSMRDPDPLAVLEHNPQDHHALFVDKDLMLDPLIDIIVPLHPEKVVPGDVILAAVPRSRRVGSKPFAVEALNISTDAWETPRASQRYSSVQAGVQLANRTGALNEIEFSEFVSKTQALADAVAAVADFPSMMPQIARARELDQFAHAHDVHLSLSVRALRAAWSPGYLIQHATPLGFVPGALPGRLVVPSEQPHEEPVLVLQFETRAALADDPEQSALLDFRLSLDVPHVGRTLQPYARMRQIANALAHGMEGRITDDAGLPLEETALDQVAADLEVLYDTLEQRDLAAGSAAARRLFS